MISLNIAILDTEVLSLESRIVRRVTNLKMIANPNMIF